MKSIPPSADPEMGTVIFLDDGLSKLSPATHTEGLWYMFVCVCLVNDGFTLPTSKKPTGLVKQLAEGVHFSWSSAIH